MNKLTKALALISILVLPVIIAVFLKVFGNNEFNIPVYYEAGTNNLFKECSEQGGQPFYATDLMKDKTLTDNITMVIFFESGRNLSASELSNIWIRTTDQFGKKPIERITYSKENYLNPNNNEDQILRLAEEDFISKMHCAAVTDTTNQFILIDKAARIRGYYGVDLEEVDRLIVETKILLEE